MNKEPDEVEITQYVRPNGKRVAVYAKVGLDYVEKAKDLILSCEALSTGHVAVYGKKVGQDDEEEMTLLADNGPGENDPISVLKKLIDKLFDKGEKK